MPKVGEIVVRNGKEYKWVQAENASGYWSQCKTIKPANATYCPACVKVRKNKDNPTLVLNNKEEVFYKIYGMCSECFECVNKHKSKFIKEFEHIEIAKSNYNKPG